MNLGGLFAAVGRGRPAIESAMTDIEERPRREEAFQSQMGLQGQQRALNQMAIEKGQMQMAEMKKEQERQNAPWDLTVQPWYSTFGEPFKNQILKAGIKAKVWDENGRGITGNAMSFLTKMKQSQELFQPLIEVEMGTRHENVIKAQKAFNKAALDPNTPKDKLDELKSEMNTQMEGYYRISKFKNDYAKDHEVMRNLQGASDYIYEMKRSGMLDQMSPQEQKMLIISAATSGIKGMQDFLLAQEKSLAPKKPGTPQEKGVTEKGYTVWFNPDKQQNWVTSPEGQQEPYNKSKHGSINPTATTFIERAQTGETKVGSPEQRSLDVRAIREGKLTLEDITKGSGMGGMGAAYSREIRSQVMREDPNFNFKLQEAQVKGNTSEILAIRQQMAKLMPFAETAKLVAKDIIPISKKVWRTGVPLLNVGIVKGELRVTGNTSAAELNHALVTFVDEYARVVTTATGGGVTTDTSRKQIADVINMSQTPQQLEAVMNNALQFMQHRETSFDKILTDVEKQFGVSGIKKGVVTGNAREQAISELQKRGKVVNEDSIKQAIKLMGVK